MRSKLIILSATAISLVLGVSLLVCSKSWIAHFDEGVYRTTYQFLLLVVAGGAVSWRYREFSRLQEIRENDRSEVRDLHSELVESYNSYKEIKRLLRALAWRRVTSENGEKEDVLLVSSYVPLLERLNLVQLKFEAHKRSQKKINPLLSRKDSERLGEALGVIEGYLNEVVKDFESALRDKADVATVKLGDLARTSEFIGPGSMESAERRAAIKGFHDAIELLERCSSMRNRA